MTAVYFKTSEAQENDAVSAQAYVRKENGLASGRRATVKKPEKPSAFFQGKQKMSADVIS